MSEPWVIRKSGAFYRPDRAGYTNHPEAAGIYTRDEAEREAAIEPNCISAHPLAQFRGELQRNFDLAKAALEKIDRAIASTSNG